MAEKQTNQLSLSGQGFGSLSVMRQMGILIGLAASIAIGGAVAFWSQTPNYRSLYTGLADRDVMEVSDALQKAGIPFEIEGAGTVKVPGDQIHDARIKLAAQGLPNSNSGGFEVLDKNQTFGTSQFMEKARYQRALEGELSQTISSLRNVESARLHLAIPKQSVFIRNQKKPSASVLVNLYPGRNLDEGQVAAISHMVASSIPNLDTEHVSIVDNKGRLLSSPDATGEMGMTTSQFSHRKRLEDYLTKRIEALITPIVGVGGVRAQVTTDLDFSMTEQTQEHFNPDLPAVRSEQTMEEQMAGGQGASGVPGALTNQPPEGGTISEDGASGTGQGETKKSNRRVTRNYELDRTISHVRLPAGSVRRLSVAVVVDDRQIVDENGEGSRQPIPEQELAHITTLVKEAVGFNARRGDTVSVINTSFNVPAPVEPLPEPPIFEQPWVWKAGKMALGALAVLFTYILVLRPVMRSLAEKGAALPPPAPPVDVSQLSQEQLALTGGGGQIPQLPNHSSYDNNLNAAQGMVQEDPKRVAQLVKQWVSEDG